MNPLKSMASAARRAADRHSRRQAEHWLGYLSSGLRWDPAFRRKTERAFARFPWESEESAAVGVEILRSLFGRGFAAMPEGRGPGERAREMLAAGLAERERKTGISALGRAALRPDRLEGMKFPDGKGVAEEIRERIARRERRAIEGVAGAEGAAAKPRRGL